jgi:hypothetical protein
MAAVARPPGDPALEVSKSRTRFMASPSIGCTAKSEEFSIFSSSGVTRGSLLTLRIDCTGTIRFGMSAPGCTKHIFRVRRPRSCQPQTRPRSKPRGALESCPYRSTGQAKWRAHLPREGPSSAAARRAGSQSATRRQRASGIAAGPGRGPIKAPGSGTVAHGDLRGRCPTRVSSFGLLGGARPWRAPVRLRTTRTGPAWFVSCYRTSVISLIDDALAHFSPGNRERLAGGPGGTAMSPPWSPARRRRNLHRTW